MAEERVQLIEGSPSHWMPEECRDAVEAENPSAIFALFSGGHDSLCATHIAANHPRFKAVVHCNTGIGIEETREYVRQVCRDQGWPLYERHPDRFTYRDLILGAGGYHGMPGGPRSHMRAYYYLKSRAIDGIVRDFKKQISCPRCAGSGNTTLVDTDQPEAAHGEPRGCPRCKGRGTVPDPTDRIGLVTGIRKAESTRRMAGAFAEYAHRDGAQLWLNPILDWTEADKNAYMEEWDLPRNEVVDVLHRSGECLCGAFTSKGEFRMIEIFYPETAAKIKALEDEHNALYPEEPSYWGRRGERENPDQLDFLPMCVGCERMAA